jgi:mannose-6-phosphate isomerase-like protein (cupin superfamily)
MYVRGKADSPRGELEGLRSHILLQAGDAAESNLAITWVDVAPGGAQAENRHEPEQVYVVIAGRGRMHVGAESRELEAGEMAHVPGNVSHYIVNTGSGTLSYISAATPAFDVESNYGPETA